MTITLTYTRTDGSQGIADFDVRATMIYLNYQEIANIDLAPLSSCANLQRFTLGGNQLQTVDLTPLSSCTTLQRLDLSSNLLQSIDLSPLSPCVNLHYLDLRNNKLQNIDLSPLTSVTSLKTLNLNGNELQAITLSSCTSLQELILENNKLQSIDLSPLSSCANLQWLNLHWNPLDYICLTPLSSCINLQRLDLGHNLIIGIDLSPLDSCSCLHELDIENPPPPPSDEEIILESGSLTPYASWLGGKWAYYQRPNSVESWAFLHHIAIKQGTDLRVQQDILVALGFEHYGFIDSDLEGFFLSMPPETALEEVHNRVTNVFVDEIAVAVDSGGATTGLKFEELYAQHGEIAKRTQRIIELRRREMEEVVVLVDGKEADLRELYLTAYGYEVLSALRIRLTIKLDKLETVRSVLAELGFELRTGETSVSGVKMSEDLKETIWWIVENKGRPWYEFDERFKLY